MTTDEKIELLVNATDNYIEIRIKTSDEFIDMMKFMFKDKYKLIEHKEKEYYRILAIAKSILDDRMSKMH